jgi:hypothetical protein
LVARLTSAETSQHLPPMPSFRQISTTSPNNAKKSTPTKEEDTATIKNDKELSTGPEISSKTEEAEAFEEPTKEELNAAPGLPESGKVAPSSGEKLGVKMPTQEAEDAADQIIVCLLLICVKGYADDSHLSPTTSRPRSKNRSTRTRARRMTSRQRS